MTSRIDEPELTTADQRQARARLERQHEHLMERLRGSPSADRDGGLTATHGAGETEHVVLGVERGIAAAVATNLRTALDATDAALARLDDGSYGLCATCGGPIGRARLEVMPEARWCVSCQTRSERGR
jgi:RNA polymerase-binding transcription factor